MQKDKQKEFLFGNKRPLVPHYGFNGNITLVSFVKKKMSCGTLILNSSMHHSAEMVPQKNKPEIICFYNETKCVLTFSILSMQCTPLTREQGGGYLLISIGW